MTEKDMIKIIATVLRNHSYLLMLSNKEIDTLDEIIKQLGGIE